MTVIHIFLAIVFSLVAMNFSVFFYFYSPFMLRLLIVTTIVVTVMIMFSTERDKIIAQYE